MNIEQIEVTIGPDGKVRIQTSGFSGEDCFRVTEEMETMLGNQIILQERTAEAYENIVGRSAEKVKIRR